MQPVMGVGERDRQTGTWEAGPLRFEASFRYISGDRGPSVRVIARQSLGAATAGKQLLRYDCFQHYPHSHLYHADGTGGDRVLRTGVSAAGAVAAALADLRAALPQTLQSLGYDELAASLDDHTAVLSAAVTALGKQLTADAADL